MLHTGQSIRRCGLVPHLTVCLSINPLLRGAFCSIVPVAMHIPRPYQQSTVDDTRDIMQGNERFFGYFTNFKYLGTTFTPELNDSNNTQL
jgi:hypothetical protein